MDKNQNQKKHSLISVSELSALADGIFAFAMTLLVLSFTIPDSTMKKQINTALNKSSLLHQEMFGYLQDFYIYVLAFFLLANYWIIFKKQLKAYKKFNGINLWLGISVLLFVAIMPFTTSISSDFSWDWLCVLLFNLNILAIVLLLDLCWVYSTKNKELVVEGLQEETVRNVKFQYRIALGISFLAIILSFISPPNAAFAYLLFIPISIIEHYKSKQYFNKSAISE